MVKGSLFLFYLHLALASSVLFSQEPNPDSLIIESGEVLYDGKTLCLEGEVRIQHALGQIAARRCTVLPSSLGVKNRCLHVSGEVQIKLRGGGELFCQQAEIDQSTLQGIFLGDDQNPDVVYTDKGVDGKTSYSVKSKKMIVHLLRESKKGTSSFQTSVKAIEATEHVSVHFNQDAFHAPKASQGPYPDAKSQQVRQIKAPGGMRIDYERQEMLLLGLPTASDLSEEERQVYLEGVMGEVYADQALLKYKGEKKHLIPEKLTLEGHVCLKNRFSGHLQESGSILHYALADQAIYFPEKQEMLLSSQGEKRVLLFDKVNHMQMSAASLKVKHDPLTNKNSFQGSGDVRFTFIEKEWKEFQKHFRLGESSNSKKKD